MRKIILASNSPRRKELLASAGYTFDVVPSDIDEKSHETQPDKFVVDIARKKAAHVAGKVHGGVIIAADTIVYAGGEIIGKVKTKDAAAAALRKLSGRTHYVWTGVCIMDIDQNKTVSFASKSAVTFRELTAGEIDWYVNFEKNILDLAGAYAIQGGAAIFVKKVTGDYNSIVGLPISKVYSKLKAMDCGH